MKVIPIICFCFAFTNFYGQDTFEQYKIEKDSLNKFNYLLLTPEGKFNSKKLKTGFWKEYELLADSAEQLIPVTLQLTDTSFNFEFPKPSVLQKKEGDYNDGLMINQWKWFVASYVNGKLEWEVSKETHFRKGKKNGLEREFSLGAVTKEANFLDDELNGVLIYYQPTNVIYLKSEWKKGIKLIGSHYYSNGNIKKTWDYKGLPYIYVIEYYENGKVKLKYRTIGENETLDGQYETYDKNGSSLEVKYFKDGIEVKK